MAIDPITLSAIMAGVGGLQEATTGREQEQRDALLKATAYRMTPYMRLNPEEFTVRRADPFGGLVQGGMSGYSLGKGIESDAQAKARSEAVTNFLNAKGAQAGGRASMMLDQSAAQGMSRSPYRLLEQDLNNGDLEDLISRYRLRG